MHKKFTKFGRDSSHYKLKSKKKHHKDKSKDRHENGMAVKIKFDKKHHKHDKDENEYLKHKRKEKKKKKLLEKLEKKQYVEQYLQNLNTSPTRSHKRHQSKSADREHKHKHKEHHSHREKPTYEEKEHHEHSKHRRHKSEDKQKSDDPKSMNAHVFYCQIQPTPKVIGNTRKENIELPPEKPHKRHSSKDHENNVEDNKLSRSKNRRDSNEKSPSKSPKRHKNKNVDEVFEDNNNVKQKDKESRHNLGPYEKYFAFEDKSAHKKQKHASREKEQVDVSEKRKSKKSKSKTKDNSEAITEVEEKLKHKLEEDIKSYFTKIQDLIDKKFEGMICTKSKMKVSEDSDYEMKKTHRKKDSRRSRERSEEKRKLYKKRSKSRPTSTKPKQNVASVDKKQQEEKRYKSPLPEMNVHIRSDQKNRPKLTIVPSFHEIKSRHYNSLSSLQKSSENIYHHIDLDNRQNKFIVEGVEPPNFESSKGKQRPRQKKQLNLECKTISIFGIPSTITKEAIIAVNQTQTSDSLNIQKPSEDVVEERKKTRRFKAYYKYSIGDTTKNSSDSSEIKSIVSDSHRVISDPSDVEERPTKQPKTMQITIPEYYFKKRKHRIATPVDSKLNNISEETSNDSSKKNKAKKKIECKYFRTLQSSNSDCSLRIVPKSGHSNVSIQSRGGYKKQLNISKYFTRQVNILSSVSTISMCHSVSKDVIKLYRSISDVSNEVRMKQMKYNKARYCGNEVKKLYEAKPRIHEIKKSKYFEEVDTYFDRRKFLKQMAKKIEEEEREKYYAKKENMADILWEQFQQKMRKSVVENIDETSPKQKKVDKKSVAECQKDSSSKEVSSLPSKTIDKKRCSRDVAIEVSGPILPICVDIGVEVSPIPSKVVKEAIEMKDVCIGMTPKASPRLIHKDVKVETEYTRKELPLKEERRIDSSPKPLRTNNYSPRACSPPIKQQFKPNISIERKPITPRFPKVSNNLKNEPTNCAGEIIPRPMSKISLSPQKQNSKPVLTTEKSKPKLQPSKQNLRPTSANPKNKKLPFENIHKKLIRSSSLVVVSSHKKCVALNTSKSEVGFKESKICSLVCIDKSGNKNKFMPKSTTEHSLDRFASSTSSRFFGSSRFFTKDYKGNNDISSYQRRKLYDEEMRKKNRKKVQRENTNPQIFEVRYMTTASVDNKMDNITAENIANANITKEVINKNNKCEENKCVQQETVEKKCEHADVSEKEAFELFKSFLNWNQKKNPSQFCDNCVTNKNFEAVIEFLYKTAMAKEETPNNNQNEEKQENQPGKKKINKTKIKTKEETTNVEKTKIKNKEECPLPPKKEEKQKVATPREDVKKSLIKKPETPKPEIINYFPQQSRSKMYNNLKKMQQEYKKKASSDGENSDEVIVIGPASLPKFDNQDSSFEFMYENDCNFSKQSAISLLTSLQLPPLQDNVKQFNVEIEQTQRIQKEEDAESPKSCSEESGYSSVVSKSTRSRRDFFKMPTIAALFNSPYEYLLSASDNSMTESINNEELYNRTAEIELEENNSIAYQESQDVDFDLEVISDGCEADIESTPVRNVSPRSGIICEDTVEIHDENCSKKYSQLIDDYEEIPLNVLLNKKSSILVLSDNVPFKTKSLENMEDLQDDIIDCKIVLSNESLKTDSVTFLTDVFSQKVLPNVTEDCEKIQLDILCHNTRGKDSISKFDNPEKFKQFMAKKFFRNLLNVYEKEMEVSKKLCEDKYFEKHLLECIEKIEIGRAPKKPKKSIKGFFKKFKGTKPKDEQCELDEVKEISSNVTVGKFLDENHQQKLKKLAYDARRYFTMFVQAVKVNQNINDEMKICGLLKLLQRIERGDFTILRREEEVNFEQEIKEQIKQAFLSVYEISLNEAKKFNRTLTETDILLIRTFVSKYRIGLLSKTDIIASYIGRGVFKSEQQLKAAVTYLMRLQTNQVDLKNFDEYCKIA